MSFAPIVLAALIGCVLAHGGHEVHSGQLSSDTHPWIGKWESTGRQENFDNFLAALQISIAHYEATDKVFHKLWEEDDHFHHKIVIPSKNYTNELEFKLGVEGTSNFNNTEFKYLYKEEAGGLQAVYTISSKVITDHYKITGDELEKTFQIGDVVAKKWFSRVKRAHQH